MNQEIIKLLANIVRTYQDDAPQTQIAADGGSSPIPNNILTEKLDLLGKRTDIKTKKRKKVKRFLIPK